MGAFGSAYDAEAGTGVTPEQLQHVLRSHWTNSASSPVIEGGVVSGRGDMAYGYTSGVGVVPTASGVVEAEWNAGATSLVSTPSVKRIDTIYVDAVGQVGVTQGGNPPAGAVILEKMELPAGATSTINAKRTWNKRYALPYGSTLGWRCMFIEPYTQGTWAIQGKTDWVTRSFFVPTDRHVQMQMAQCIFGVNASNPSSMCFGSFRYGLYIDDVLVRVFELGYDRRQTANLFHTNLEVSAGEHTIKLDRELVWRDDAKNQGPQHFGSGNNIWQPGFMGVLDVGVKE